MAITKLNAAFTRAELEALRDAMNDKFGDVDHDDVPEDALSAIYAIDQLLEPASDEACPGCGCNPGDGITDTCYHPGGCGTNRANRMFAGGVR